MNHKLSKDCECDPLVISFKGDKKISEIILSYIRILAEHTMNGKVNSMFLEKEAQKLIESLEVTK